MTWYSLTRIFCIKKNHTEKKQSYTGYKIKLVKTSLNKVLLSDYKRQWRLSNRDIPLKGHWNHFPTTLSKQKLTRVCQVDIKNEKRSKTWECKKSRFTLHVSYCFERFYMIINFLPVFSRY